MEASPNIRQIEAIEGMAGNQLSVLHALMPYLQMRQRLAQDYLHSQALNNGAVILDHLRDINKEISKILSLSF